MPGVQVPRVILAIGFLKMNRNENYGNTSNCTARVFPLAHDFIFLQFIVSTLIQKKLAHNNHYFSVDSKRLGEENKSTSLGNSRE